MFENLSEKIASAFKQIKGEGRITDLNIANTVKDIRKALLDADVNFKIAKEFTDRVKEKAIGEEGDGTMIDILENENVDAVDGESQKESMMYEIELALSSLPAKQQQVLKSLYGIGMDRPLGMEDIGEEMGLTRERVRQIRDQALITLRRHTNARRLKTFL